MGTGPVHKATRGALLLLAAIGFGTSQLGAGSAASRAQTAIADPANLKGERIRAGAAEPLPVDRGASGVQQLLAKLRTRASLLMIVAHPDDEDGGMLTYESRGRGARVGVLTLTRGEGGQNFMTGDFNDALGLVRTRELLAADRYFGTDQMFGTEVDFGFSKTKEEAFSQWTHQRVLYDAVRAVRLYRPLILTSVFLGGPTDGHGHHQVSGEIAQEVFTAAADPKVFPEMGLPPWAPAKVYARVPFSPVEARGMFDYATGKWVPTHFTNYVTGASSNQAPRATVTIPEGEPSPLLGESYVRFARRGLAVQRSQISGEMRLPPEGRMDVGYTRYGDRTGSGTRPQEQSFFDGIDTSLAGIASLAPSLRGADTQALHDGLAALDDHIQTASNAFSTEHPERAAPALRDALGTLDTLIARLEQATSINARERYDVLHELRVKRVQANDALTLALGLGLTASLAEKGGVSGADTLAPGQSFAVQAQLRNPTHAAITIERAYLEEQWHAERQSPSHSEISTEPDATGALPRLSGTVPEDAPGTQPPYTRRNLEQPVYDLADPSLRNAPVAPPPLTVWALVRYGDVDLRLGRVVGVERDGAYQPVTITPAVSVDLAPAAAVAPLSEKQFQVTATVTGRNSAEPPTGTVRLEAPAGWHVSPDRSPWNTAGGKSTVTFSVTPSPLAQKPYPLAAVAESNDKQYRSGFNLVGYPGLVRDALYRPAVAQVRGVDIAVPPGLKVAYLPGTGDSVESSFAEIGIRATRLSVADIAAGRLAGYDALVLGVRAYTAHAELHALTDKLLDFARSGGVVVVQYNLAHYGSADAPYPLSLGTVEKVVEERAPVQFAAPQAQVLRWPNHLSERDFDGWVEERGHGFMGEWDPHYIAATEVHDAGQDPQRGGLLVAPVGKGAYVYCAFALYRQLPEGVPGAYRLLANLVSLGRHP